MKKILVALGILIAVISGGVFWFVQSLDGIVKTQIEAVGTELLGVAVSVETVSISLREGTGTISGLSVANPPGYITDSALQLGTLHLQIDTSSLSGSPLVLKKLTVDSLAGNLELRDDDANLIEITRSIQSNTASAEEATKPTDSGQPVMLSIGELLIANTTITVTAGDEVSSKALPTIALQDVGGAEGTSPASVAGIVVNALIAEILKHAAAERLEKTMEDALQNATRGLMDSLNRALQ